MRLPLLLSRRALLAIGSSLLALPACGWSSSANVPLGSGPLSVLVLYGGPVVPDVPSKLQSTGLFSVVDVFDVSFGTPSLSLLTAHDVTLVMHDGPVLFDDPVALGDALKTYIDVGGGVVVADVSMMTISLGLDGTFDGANYHAIPEVVVGIDPPRSMDGPWTVTADLPAHPIVTGGGVGQAIPMGLGDYGSRRPATPASWIASVPGAVQVAHWNDGTIGVGNTNATGVPTPLIVARDLFPTTGVIARRVDLGISPQTGHPGSLQHPNAFSIYVNALLYVGYRI